MKSINKSFKKKLAGISAIAIAIALVLAACGNKSTGDISSPNYPIKPNPELTKPGYPEPVPGSFFVFFDTGDRYSEIAYQTIKEGEYASMPEEESAKIIPGLYRGDSGPSTFLTWINSADGSEWFFSEYPVTKDTYLEAVWYDPEQVIVTDSPGDNVIEKSIAYVKANPGTYTLYLDDDYAIKTQDVKANGLYLTIKGIHRERTISLASGKGALFILGKWDTGDKETKTEFFLGENITLEGITTNTDALVLVGHWVVFTMLPGSKITGNVINDPVKAPAVELLQDSHNSKGTFIMKGGEISGNENLVDLKQEAIYKPSSAVLVPIKSTFEMEGGSIIGNEGGVGELVYIVSSSDSSADTTSTNHAVLSGNSRIGRIALVEEGKYLKRSLSVIDWVPVGSTIINLAGNQADSDIRTWFESFRIVNPFSSNVPLITNNIKLGDVYNGLNQYFSPISKLLRLDNETGKLVKD